MLSGCSVMLSRAYVSQPSAYLLSIVILMLTGALTEGLYLSVQYCAMNRSRSSAVVDSAFWVARTVAPSVIASTLVRFTMPRSRLCPVKSIFGSERINVALLLGSGLRQRPPPWYAVTLPSSSSMRIVPRTVSFEPYLDSPFSSATVRFQSVSFSVTTVSLNFPSDSSAETFVPLSSGNSNVVVPLTVLLEMSSIPRSTLCIESCVRLSVVSVVN